jgi:hypothetical protein
MCRWLAYTVSSVLLTDVLYTPVHSLIDQSLHSRLGAETTNGDEFGVGWYDTRPVPGVFRSIEPGTGGPTGRRWHNRPGRRPRPPASATTSTTTMLSFPWLASTLAQATTAALIVGIPANASTISAKTAR